MISAIRQQWHLFAIPADELFGSFFDAMNAFECPFGNSGLPRQRTNEGRLEAKLKGIRFGRRRTIDRNSVLALHCQGTGATDIARQLSIARSTVYKILEDEKGT